jgi:uncharacterized protein
VSAVDAPGPPYTVHRAGRTVEARRAFARAITPYLAKREAENNLQLGVLDHVAAGRFTAATLLLAEDAHGDTAAVLMRTPPHALLVAAGDVPAAREALLSALLDDAERLPGMVGPLPDVEGAAAWWSAHTGAHARRRMHQGVYRLRAVKRSDRAAGRLRAAEERDRYLVIPWLDAFGREALDGTATDAARVWDSFQGESVRRLYLWETPEGRSVSLAAVSGRTPNGVRISSVYTPPEERRRGYASALVAALSRSELESGTRFCFLYTDLANPTSNHIYRDVGYERVGEAAEYVFE